MPVEANLELVAKVIAEPIEFPKALFRIDWAGELDSDILPSDKQVTHAPKRGVVIDAGGIGGVQGA